jgi:hypothetical protein
MTPMTTTMPAPTSAAFVRWTHSSAITASAARKTAIATMVTGSP